MVLKEDKPLSNIHGDESFSFTYNGEFNKFLFFVG